MIKDRREIDLQTKILRASKEYPTNQNKYFLPNDKLEALVTEFSIREELDKHCPEYSYLTLKISQFARRLFVILLITNGLEHLPAFIEEGISDNVLPFNKYRNQEGDLQLRKQGYSDESDENQFEISAMRDWTKLMISRFAADQWLVYAPIFHSGHNELLDGQEPPFIYDGRRTDHIGSNGEAVGRHDTRAGGYGKVWAAKLHYAHERLFPEPTKEGEEPLIAVKQLLNSSEKEFKSEAHILRELRSKDHPHMVKLLATYTWGREYFMLFPFANGNLRQFWETYEKTVSCEPVFIQWYLDQVTGLASALRQIHVFKSNSSRVSETNLGAEVVNETFLGVPVVEPRYGRHGDIKPENILWEKLPNNDDLPGVLKIADLGLARFHRQQSRSAINPHQVVGSPTYEPPETTLKLLISRKYDIWSMGCVYLEFTIWLLAGSDGLRQFTEARRQRAHDGVDDETFFSILPSNVAQLRPAVIDWIAKMYAHENCTPAIHDVLDLIFDKLLRTEALQRDDSTAVHKRLGEISAKAKKDKNYLSVPDSRSRQFSNAMNTTSTPKGVSSLRPPRTTEIPIHSFDVSNDNFDKLQENTLFSAQEGNPVVVVEPT